MVNPTNESESVTPLPSPRPQRVSVSNPGYHHKLLTPSTEKETNDEKRDNNFINSENYIKMSQCKNNVKSTNSSDSITIPHTEINNMKQEAYYVNGDTRDWSRI